MANSSPRGLAAVDCTASPGSVLPDGFAAAFCAVLREEIAANRPAGAAPADIDVELSRAGAYSVTAMVTVRHSSGAARSQEFSLSVRDSTLRPSIARTLLFPILQLLE